MFLSEILEQLTYGELAGLAVGGLKEGGVQPSDYPRIINNINSGLTDLYTRLPLKTTQVNVQLYEHIALYTLHTDYATTNTASTEPYKYINDSTTEPFTNDVLLITNVFNEAGDEYPINEGNEEFSVFVPSYNTIQVPFSQDENAIDIIYRAAPTKVSTVITDPTTVWVPIPCQLVEALVAYVMHKIHSSFSLGEDNAAGMYFNKYLRAVEMVKEMGLVTIETNLNEKLDIGGWI